MNLTYNEIMLVKFYRGTDERGKSVILKEARVQYEEYPNKPRSLENNVLVSLPGIENQNEKITE